MSVSGPDSNHLTMKELRLRWQKAFGSPPPRASRDLLELGLGWHIQSKGLGGLDRATREQITDLVADLRDGDEVRILSASPRPHPWRHAGPGVE